MALFKFRKNKSESPPPVVESVEALRARAKHRLMGAAVLVLVGVVGFPLLFDTQPRPVAINIPIEIPDKNQVKPMVSAPVASAPAVVASGSVGRVEPVTPVAEPAAAAVKPVPVAPAASEPPKAEAPVAAPVKPEVVKPDVAKSEPVKTEPAAAQGRFVVQVGAYADVLKAREVRAKLKKAGLETYTQVVDSAEGRRIRVRLGPYGSKAEADKVIAKLKKLDLSAKVLEL